MLCEMAWIVKGVDRPLTSTSRERCVEEIDPAFWELYIRRGFESSASSTPLYLVFALRQAKVYNPSTNWPISPQSFPAFVHLIQANTTSASFSILIIYSIRHHTLIDHPDFFNHLFQRLPDSGRHSHGIGKFTISSLCPLQPDQDSQGTNFYQTYSQQQNHSFIPSGTNRKTSRMTRRLENVSK